MSARPDHDGDPLARAVIAALSRDPEAMRRLRDLVVDPTVPARDAGRPAFTVHSLAETIGLSPKGVRNAIARGELVAVKRGGRWVIAADAVEAWTHTCHGGLVARPTRARTDGGRPLRAALSRLDERRARS
jgi:excisionase family DNA binding protein